MEERARLEEFRVHAQRMHGLSLNTIAKAYSAAGEAAGAAAGEAVGEAVAGVELSEVRNVAKNAKSAKQVQAEEDTAAGWVGYNVLFKSIAVLGLPALLNSCIEPILSSTETICVGKIGTLYLAVRWCSLYTLKNLTVFPYGLPHDGLHFIFIARL